MNRTETCWSIDLSLSFRVFYRYQRLIQLKTNERLCAFVLLVRLFRFRIAFRWIKSKYAYPLFTSVQPSAHNSLVMRVHCARIKFRHPIAKLATTSDVKYNMIIDYRMQSAKICNGSYPFTLSSPWQMKIPVKLEVKIHEWTRDSFISMQGEEQKIPRRRVEFIGECLDRKE